MSENIKTRNELYSQNNVKINYPKLFLRLQKSKNFDINTEFQKYIVKSRNSKPIKKENDMPFSFNKNNITKSTFYSKLENTFNKFDTANYTITEMNQTYSNKLKKDNDSILLSSLYNVPDYKRKTINYFMRPKNNSLSINKSNINSTKMKDIQNISSILNSQNIEEKTSTVLLTNSNLDSQISNNKINLTINNKLKRKKDNYSNLEFFLKNRFYNDIEEKFNRKFQGKKFDHDNSIKDKIIQLNQVRTFWGGFLEYTNPILITKRFQYISKLIEDRKKIREINRKFGNINNFEIKKYYNFSEKKNKVKHIPKLCTISNYIKSRKKELQKEKLIERIKRNKTEQQMKLFLNSLYE